MTRAIFKTTALALTFALAGGLASAEPSWNQGAYGGRSAEDAGYAGLTRQSAGRGGQQAAYGAQGMAGQNNWAQVNQQGRNNMARVLQSGNRNGASITQRGNNKTAIVVQSGTGTQVKIRQTGKKPGGAIVYTW